MQFPESWLREFCNPPISTAELADLLTMSGLEVEEMRPVAPPFTQVVVGHVLAIERHPNADRLNVCQVDAGTGTPLNIVCGAPNVKPGIKVPCALVGAELPPAEGDSKPFTIKLGKLRGVESQGMLCSARELKLSQDHEGLLILGDDAKVGEDVRRTLSLDDTLFTLKLTPNLGHLLSLHGIAREVSALTGAPLKSPELAPVPPRHDKKLPVRVEAADLCGRFSGRVIHGIDPRAATPAWMVERLARCGQRPVNALVDISNYVMFEVGQPTHIFDFDRIDGGLVVRWGQPGESLKLLNGNTIEVDAAVGVIADGRQVESLAGIMGGDASAVSDDTRNVYVEAAFWWPEAVSGRSRRYNFSTDAGHRFERGVDPAQTVACIERVTRLILDVCGGAPGPMDDQVLALPQRKPVTLRVARATKVIGMTVSQGECEAVMTRLALPFERQEGTLCVTPPSWRFDLQLEEDLIEEVIRVIGYDKLPMTPPQAPVTARMRPESRRSSFAVRRLLAGLDYFETINFSFIEESAERQLAGNADPIRVLNPIASPLSVMRSSLVPSLIEVLRFNLARKASRVRVFEIGRVFERNAASGDGPLAVAGVHQPMRVAGLAWGPADALQWGSKDRSVDFYDIKGDVEALLAPRGIDFAPAAHPALHPGRSASVTVNGLEIGVVGELHPRWRQAYDLPTAPVLFELGLDAVLARDVPEAMPVPRQQSAWRDLAVVVGGGVTHASLMDAIRAAPTTLVRSALLFDLYKPGTANASVADGERSLAVRLELRNDEATLTDEQIDVGVSAVLQQLASQLGARLRG